jgi:pimeloyl-ACP methyl ester carboxylesterase
VEQPALVIHGQTDQVIRAGDAGRVAHALPAGGLWLVAGAGHLEAAALDPRGYRQHAAELMERANRFTGEK